MLRTTTTKSTQRDVLKNTIVKSKWNSKNCSNNPQEGSKRSREILLNAQKTKKTGKLKS